MDVWKELDEMYLFLEAFGIFRVDGTMAVLVKDAVIPKNAPTSLLLDQHAGFIAK